MYDTFFLNFFLNMVYLSKYANLKKIIIIFGKESIIYISLLYIKTYNYIYF